MKTDYARVLTLAADALKRFATGTYAVWYPVIPRPEAHDLPRAPENHCHQGRQGLAARHVGDQIRQAAAGDRQGQLR